MNGGGEKGAILSNNALPSWMVIDTDDGWGDDIVNELPGYKFYDNSVTLYFEPTPHIYFRYDEEGNRVEVPGCTTVLKTAIDKSHALVPWATKLTIEALKGKLINPDTGAINPFSTEELLQWMQEAKDKHKERLGEAGDIGHTAHDALERTIQHAIDNTGGVVEKLLPVKFFDVEPTEQEKMAQSCFEAGIDWIHKHKVIFRHTERKVYSKEFDVSGTLDGIGLVTSCDDLKCCRGKIFHQAPSIIDWKSSNALRDEYALQTSFYQFAQLEEFPDEPIYLRFVLRLGKQDGKFEPWLIPAEFFEDDLNTFLAALSLYRSLHALEERRRVDKAELRSIIKAIKDEQKAIKEAALKVEKAQAKAAKMEATKARNEAKDALYKKLRTTGVSVHDAKAQVAIEFPPNPPTYGNTEQDEPIVEQSSSTPEPNKESDPDLEWSIAL